MKDIRHDNGAFLLNIGILQMLGIGIMMLASASVYLHNADIWQDSFFGTLYSWSWLIVGFGVGIITARLFQDPKLVVALMAVGILIWYFVVMSG